MSKFTQILAVVVALGLQTGALAAAPVVFVAFGDSITDGTGDPQGIGYPGRLQKLLQPEIDAEVRKFGVPSEDTSLALSRIDAVLATGGDVFLLMEGTNDVSNIFDGLVSFETTIANLDLMARKANNRGMEPVHVTILPRPRSASRDKNNFLTLGVNFLLRELAFQKKRRLVDVYQAFDPAVVANPATFYAEGKDSVGHPNPAGYDLMAATFADVLLEIDSVPPVLGNFTPGFAEVLPGQEIRPNDEIRISLYEPQGSSGIDLDNSKLLINGNQVGEVEGNRRKIELVHQGGKALGCRARVSIVASDQASPEPNVTNRVLGIYEVTGRTVLRGDVDFDCRVDGKDLGLFGPHFGAMTGMRSFDIYSDFNRDGKIDGDDLALLAKNFGKNSRD